VIQPDTQQKADLANLQRVLWGILFLHTGEKNPGLPTNWASSLLSYTPDPLKRYLTKTHNQVIKADSRKREMM
jgi:hypothetical protein